MSLIKNGTLFLCDEISYHYSDLSNKFDEIVNILCILWYTVEHGSGDFFVIFCYKLTPKNMCLSRIHRQGL